MRMRFSIGAVFPIPYQVESFGYPQALHAPKIYPHADQLNRL